MKTGHFEGSIALRAESTAHGRDESTQHDLQLFIQRDQPGIEGGIVQV